MFLSAIPRNINQHGYKEIFSDKFVGYNRHNINIKNRKIILDMHCSQLIQKLFILLSLANQKERCP